MKKSFVDIVKRRVDLKFDAGHALGWLPGEGIVEIFLNAISFYFPSGEKFFIDSVSHYKHKIHDPVLKDQVHRFIYQEAMHTSVHNRCNKVLLEIYPNGTKLDRIGTFVLNKFRFFLPRSFQLAISCAIEHYTAILADSLFHYLDYIIERAQPEFTKLWAWHAVEETEHKAVCFDVYSHHVGRGFFAYLMRVIAMLLVTFLGTIVVATGVILIKRGRTVSPAPLSHSVEPAPNVKPNTVSLVKSLIPWRLWLDYFRPSFHPWDHDNSHYIELWKQRFPGFGIVSSLRVDEK
ncbi:metal-dependent hydrolase [Leeia oryzae]|uniref:metal-dependent hydrolase n=1 Tax=Leeia oryzae TaxID=356662 RepID=UPI00036D507D|nr:metal-dependent hydrolase [Leeia oryzae]